MSKANFKAEILRHLDRATDDVRASMASNYIHDITINFNDFGDGCQKGMDNLANGYFALDSDEKTELARINTSFNWAAAARNVSNKLATAFKTVKVGKHTLTKVAAISGYANFIGVYLVDKTSNEMTVRLYNKQAGSPMNSKTLENFNKEFRIKTYENFLATHAGKYSTKLTPFDSITSSRDKGRAVSEFGRGSPFSHSNETTVGLGMLEELNEALDSNTSADLTAIQGRWIRDAKTLDLAKAFYDAVTVEWEETPVLNPKTGDFEMKRIIKGDLDYVGRNTSTSQDNDWNNLKADLIQKLEEFLAEAKPINPADAVDFEASKSVRTQAGLFNVEVATNLVVKALTEKGLKVVSVKKPYKPSKRRTQVAKQGKNYSGTLSKGAMASVMPRGKSKSQRDPDRQTDLVNIQKLKNRINQRLPAEVRRNMGRPALINQTGTFSNSVELTELTQGDKTLIGAYTYLQNPYRTFENEGSRKWPVGYNPKPLITQSIRNLAQEYVVAKFTLRRE